MIDNCGDFEDSSMLLPGMKQKIEPPVFHSANVDGGDEFNKTLFEKYKDQIHYM